MFGTRPDGTLLLAASSGGRVQLWDPITGSPVGTPLTGHTGLVTSCAFGTRPDGTLLLASISSDQTVRVWDPATGRQAGMVCLSPSDPTCLAWHDCVALVGCSDEVIALDLGSMAKAYKPTRR